MDEMQQTLLKTVEGSKPYGKGIIFHNGNCIVTVNIGRDGNGACKWYYGQMILEGSRLFEVVRTGCFSYTRKPFITERGEVQYDPTPEENYPLPRALKAKSYHDAYYKVKSIDSWEEYESLIKE